MFLDKIAKLVSIILGPHTWSILLFIIVVLNTGLTNEQLAVVLPSVLLLQVAIPVSYLLFAPRLGWIKKWDMESKKERWPFLLLILVTYLISLLIIYVYGNILLFHLSIIIIFLIITLFIITFKWKVSLHTSLNTMAALSINFLFDWNLPLLYLTIPVIFWARLRLKKHTVSQLIMGIVVTTMVLLGGLALFGY